MKAKFGVDDKWEMRKNTDLIPLFNFPETELLQDDTPPTREE